ncbi:endonuclease domain-containing protein [Parapedobacter soli]|uniref:endonuclease domain-containing protein n=1 Tax=Parapedobacter soli TaxID=416955 RepID=UPI0021C89F50|nr:endonuclease domain-containing protein [Parapedobacter soli]
MPRKKKKPKAPGTDFFCALVRSDIKVDIVTEYRFHPVRRFRFDYAIPEYKIAVEKDGGVWMKGGGAHSRPSNILRDMEKLTLAAVDGWIVIRRTPQELCTSETLNLIRKAIQTVEAQRKSSVFSNQL